MYFGNERNADTRTPPRACTDGDAIIVRTGRYLRHGPISLPISRLCNGRALKRRGRYPPRSPRPPRACAR